jgi:lipoate-protein ligase A
MMKKKSLLAIALTSLFVFGIVYTSFAQNVNMPKTIIHHVTLKWKADASEADKTKVMADLKAILADTKGVKSVWMKSTKVQPQEFSQTFVVEFENQAALDAYAKHPKKEAWAKLYYEIRETSYNSVTTN